MSIRFVCSCGKKMKAADEHIGKKLICTDCGNPVTVPRSDTVSADDLMVSAATAAQDLMARTGSAERKSGKSKRSFGDGPDHHPGDEEEGFDYGELGRQLLTTVVPGLVAVLVVAYIVYWLSSAVIGSKPDLPELGYVTGRVTLDGQPLPGATVTFRPLAGEEAGSKLSASMGRTDEDGEFTLYYIQDYPGAVVGDHRVEIQAENENGRPLVPPRYFINSELTAEVTAGSNDEKVFELTSQ